MWRIAAAALVLIGVMACEAEQKCLGGELDNDASDFHDRHRQYEFQFLNPGAFEALEKSKYRVLTPRQNQIEFRRGNATDHFAVPRTMKFGKAAYSSDGRFLFIIAKDRDPKALPGKIQHAFLFELIFDSNLQDLYIVRDVSANVPQLVQSEHCRVRFDSDEVYSVSGDGTKVLLQASFSFRIKSQPDTLSTQSCPVVIDLTVKEEEAQSGAATLTAIGSVAKILQEFEASWDAWGKGHFDRDSIFNKNSKLQLFGSSSLVKLRDQESDIVEVAVSEWEIRRGASRLKFRVPTDDGSDTSRKQLFWGEPVVSANNSTFFVLCNEGTEEQGYTPVELWKINPTYEKEKDVEGVATEKVMDTTELAHPIYKQIQLTELIFGDGDGKRLLGICLLLKSLPEDGYEFAYYRPFLIDSKTKRAVEATADNFPSFAVE